MLTMVALIGLIAGALIAGRPSTIPRDLRAADIPPTVATTATTTTLPPTTTTRPPTTTTDAPEAIATVTTRAPATTTTTVPVDRANVYVMVSNASLTYGLATRVASFLPEHGYQYVYRADALREHGETAVFYRGDLEAEALDLADELDIDPDRVAPHPDEQIINGTANYEVLLLLGVDWASATNLDDDIPLE